jgi:cytochrome c peroxidase
MDYRKVVSFAAAVAGCVLTARFVSAQAGNFPPDKPPIAGSLKKVDVPLPSNLTEFIADKQAAIVLGKALFWDQNAGSDGLACASCHFQAGADSRIKNQLDPGLRNAAGGAINQTFNLTASNKNSKSGPPPGGGPNYTLKKADFPFHQLSDPSDANSNVLFDTDDVVSSQGVFQRDFDSELTKNKKGENCQSQISIFTVNGRNVRQVEPRNTPTVINSVFNFRNFWDGRANNIFNGRNPFGLRDKTAGVDPANSIQVADASGKLQPYPVVIPDASLASQSVGPPTSDLEMSCSGRAFENIGQKLISAVPLSNQTVDPTDSVLGPYVNKSKKNSTGLNATYANLIQKAFQPKFWNSSALTSEGDPQMVKNFSLYWGLSIMLYESTLVSDDSPFDKYMDGNISALTTPQLNGFQVFNNNGGCIFCHKGAEFTGAATALKTAQAQGGLLEHMIMGDGNPALYDSGFYNIGVRPTNEDLGAGALDPWGNPLSWSRQAKNAAGSAFQNNLFNVGPDLFNVFACNFQVAACTGVTSDFRDSVDGSFKVPTLRNIELTGPYFHNGGTMTLEQVIDFYNRGGDARGTSVANTTGYGLNPSNRAPAIQPLGLSAADKANLVAFLKSLTDERVRWEMAPFDHPSLQVPNGHKFDESKVIPDGSKGYAQDEYLNWPAVGAAGRAPQKLPPLQPFEMGLP